MDFNTSLSVNFQDDGTLTVGDIEFSYDDLYRLALIARAWLDAPVYLTGMQLAGTDSEKTEELMKRYAERITKRNSERTRG